MKTKKTFQLMPSPNRSIRLLISATAFVVATLCLVKAASTAGSPASPDNALRPADVPSVSSPASLIGANGQPIKPPSASLRTYIVVLKDTVADPGAVAKEHTVGLHRFFGQ